MSPFSNTRTKRRTIYAVLLVWLFALGSAWANTCLLQERDTHWHGPLDDTSETTKAARVSPGHVGADSEHAENAGPAKSACLKVCGDESRVIVKLTSSVDLADVAMAPPSVPAWSGAAHAAPVKGAWLALRAPSPGVPLRTRFSRLSL